MRIDEIDKNLKVDSEINKSGLKFYSFEDEPFEIYGNIKRGEDGLLYRLPREVAEATSPGVLGLSTNTAGGRVRFRTNSGRVAIIAKYHSVNIMPHFPITGSVGLDVFADDVFKGGFVPPVDMPNKAFESVNTVGDGTKEQDITINLPLYSNLTELYIGIDEGASLSVPTPYKYEKPIVYYGSSITQGGCASRPGCSYQAFLTRWLGHDHINLGFSGNAKGEEAITDYIASLDMRIFVCDYDHNAPTAEHLEATHMPLYRKVRAAHPDLPIIFMTRPNGTFTENRLVRRAIVKKTYDTAVAEDDKNVYFLDPTENTPVPADEGTVEGCHPTDLGFYFMAQSILPIIKSILK